MSCPLVTTHIHVLVIEHLYKCVHINMYNNFFFFFISVLRECKNVELAFSDVTSKTDLLKGTKKGTVYLTPYRVKARITFIFYEVKTFWLL